MCDAPTVYIVTESDDPLWSVAALQAPGTVDEETMIAFVQAINGLRLVLGTMLDVSEDIDPDDIDDADPLAGEHHLYNFLSWLLDWAVRALGEPSTA